MNCPQCEEELLGGVKEPISTEGHYVCNNIKCNVDCLKIGFHEVT